MIRFFGYFFLLLFFLASCTTQNATDKSRDKFNNFSQDLSREFSQDFDDTSYLQALLSSGEKEILIPKGIRAWVSGPLVLQASDTTIIFEQGCIIKAKRDSFLSSRESLLTILNSTNVSLIGYNAELQMERSIYAKKPFERGEWRHGIALYTSSNILISGLTIRETGGDGVYIGQRRGEDVCKNIILRDLFILDNWRQGVSVISVDGFLMEGCTVRGTKGTPPAAGIDFEPNSGLYGLTNCVIRNCVFEKNSGPGFLVYLKKMTHEQPPVSIRIEDTIIRQNLFSVSIYSIPKGVRGSIEFTNTKIQGLRFVLAPKGFSVTYDSP